MPKLFTTLSLIFISLFVKGQSPDFIWATDYCEPDFPSQLRIPFSQQLLSDNFGNVYNFMIVHQKIMLDKQGYTVGMLAARPLILKYNSMGQLIWKKPLVSEFDNPFSKSQREHANAYYSESRETAKYCVDQHGSLYILGTFTAPEFKLEDKIMKNSNKNLKQEYYSTLKFNPQCYIAKYDSSGKFIYSKEIDTKWSTTCSIESFYMDSENVFYISGSYTEPSISLGPFNLINADANTNKTKDFYIAAIDSGGNFIWAKSFGGQYDDFCKMNVSKSGSIYLSGTSNSNIFSMDSLKPKLESSDYKISFIAKLSNNGNVLFLKKPKNLLNISSIIYSEISKPIFDISGNLILASVHELNKSAQVNNQSSGRSFSAIVSKYSASGDSIWTNNIANSGNINIFAINTDDKENIYLSAIFYSGEISINKSVIKNNNIDGGYDLLVIKLDKNGNYLDAFSFGGYYDEREGDMIVDNNENLFMTFGSYSPEITFGSLQLIRKERHSSRHNYFAKLRFK